MYLPFGHFRQVDPAVENCPASQSEHLYKDSGLLVLPEGQFSHEDAPETEIVPSSQLLQEIDPATSANFPEGQSTQLAVPELAVYFPSATSGANSESGCDSWFRKDIVKFRALRQHSGAVHFSSVHFCPFSPVHEVQNDDPASLSEPASQSPQTSAPLPL